MNKINKTIKFGRSLIGMPYTQNMYKKWEANNTPPYYAVTPKTSKDQLQIPDIKELFQKGSNCSGFINLLIRFNGNFPPGTLDNQIGNIPAWHLEFINDWKPMNYDIIYPKCTLLLRTKQLNHELGHLALVSTKNEKHFMEQNIIHMTSKYGLIEENIRIATKNEKSFFQYYLLPYEWM